MSDAPAKLNILRIDSRRDDIGAAMAELRRRLSPRGDVVSQAGRERTIRIFGEPLSPLQVVERICRDVEERGIDAVIEYTERIDGVRLTRETIRVSADELARAMRRPPLSSWRPFAASATTSASFRKRSCTATSASSGRAGISSNAICRSSGPAFACRAARRPIPRRC